MHQKKKGKEIEEVTASVADTKETCFIYGSLSELDGIFCSKTRTKSGTKGFSW